jgi:Ca2+-binding EF-hand superfamily protein
LNPFGGSKPGLSAEAEGAPGQPAPPKRVPESAALLRFDTNGDGILTKDELEQTLKADFKKDDLNGDQELDPAEARALNEQLRQQKNMSPVFDWNADGQIVYSEFVTQWHTLFARADRNSDGVVDAEELAGHRREPVQRPLPQPEMSKVDPTRNIAP